MLIIDKGTLLYNGTLEELKRKNASSHNNDFIPKKRMNDSLEQIIRTIYEGGGL